MLYRYAFTMNMPTRLRKDDHEGASQNLVHMIIGDFDGDMDSVLSELSNSPFILVQEVYPDNKSNVVKNMGPILLNAMHIGKVKYWN